MDSLLPLGEPELQALVSQAQDGDTDAFGRLYDHFFPQVYRYAAFRVSGDLAEDITADIFVKAWEKIHTYTSRKGIPFGAWLFRIARHEVIDAYRKQRGEIVELSEEVSDPDEWNAADDRVRRSELLRTVRTAMDRLPRRYREVLHLSYIAELPTQEISRVLRLSEGAIRILKFRALKKLESLLPQEHREVRNTRPAPTF